LFVFTDEAVVGEPCSSMPRALREVQIFAASPATEREPANSAYALLGAGS